MFRGNTNVENDFRVILTNLSYLWAFEFLKNVGFFHLIFIKKGK